MNAREAVPVRLRQDGTASVRPIQAMPCGVQGLVINPAVDAPGLMITHTRSGIGVAWFPAADPEAVLAAAQDLADVADWTASAHDIADEVSGAEVLEICGRWGGRFYPNYATGADRDDLPEATQ